MGEPIHFKLEGGSGFSCNGKNPLHDSIQSEIFNNLAPSKDF